MKDSVLRWSILSIILVSAICSLSVAADRPKPVGAAMHAEAPYRSTLTEPTYHSGPLGGNFLAQWMYIDRGNIHYEFWGARIVGLDNDSPLHGLHLRAGDVITRLDGFPIENGMYQGSKGEWIIPELDRHYGGTEFRYIYQGTSYVNVGSVNLNNNGSGSNAIPP